jgi:hypothetical protein
MLHRGKFAATNTPLSLALHISMIRSVMDLHSRHMIDIFFQSFFEHAGVSCPVLRLKLNAYIYVCQDQV